MKESKPFGIQLVFWLLIRSIDARATQIKYQKFLKLSLHKSLKTAKILLFYHNK